jgi:hypothetical protein
MHSAPRFTLIELALLVCHPAVDISYTGRVIGNYTLEGAALLLRVVPMTMVRGG